MILSQVLDDIESLEDNTELLQALDMLECKYLLIASTLPESQFNDFLNDSVGITEFSLFLAIIGCSFEIMNKFCSYLNKTTLLTKPTY
jgi:hypothetical protein